MRIRLAIIPLDNLAVVMRLITDLRNAVNSGDMDGVDTATEGLIAATANSRFVDITEEEWCRFLSEVRANNEAFQSDYLVPAQACLRFFPDARADEMVLQFPFAEREGGSV